MEKIICKNCNTILANLENRCSNCGSNEKILKLFFIDKIDLKENIRYKCKNINKKGKKKIELEVLEGDEISTNTGKWVKKERIIDRKNNVYYEHVETINGELIHHCNEKLSDHFGHGSAKIKEK